MLFLRILCYEHSPEEQGLSRAEFSVLMNDDTRRGLVEKQ